MSDACHVPDCGNRRCGTCDERLMCTGPEPVAVACGAHDDECQSCNDDHRCPDCKGARMEARSAEIWEAAKDAQPPWMTPAEEWASHWAEQRKEEREYELAHLEDREEQGRYGAA